MKNLFASVLVGVSLLTLSSCQWGGGKSQSQPVMKQENSMEQKMDIPVNQGERPQENTAMERQEPPVKPQNSMERKSSETMQKMAPKVSGYTSYSEDTLDAAIAQGKRVALFFHASWCPSCQELHNTLTSETVPSDVVVLKVDYDSATEMKKHYGVTGQHTIVTLDSNKNMIKKDRGSRNIAQIVSLF